MTSRFEQLLRLETEFQNLTKLRDELFERDDAEVSGFQLATILAAIAKVEKEIRALRRAPVLA